MHAKIIVSATEFSRLAGPWETLARASAARPFQDFGWAVAWVSRFDTANAAQLRVGTLWDDGHLLAVLPLVSRRYNGVRLLEWIGARLTDYCDALVAPGIDAGRALQLIWNELVRRGDFDVLRLGGVRDDARINALLDGLRPWIETSAVSRGIPISWDSGDAFVRQLSPRRRRRLRHDLRRTELHLWHPPAPFEPLLDTLLEQKRSWLAMRGMDSVLNEPQVPAFLHALGASMARNGTLRLCALRFEGKVAACQLAFVRGGVHYAYISSYDPSLAKHSFGSVLIHALIMQACDDGLRRFDMLLGDEAFKTAQYGSSAEPLRTVVVPRGLLGGAALMLYKAKICATRARRRGGTKAEPEGEIPDQGVPTANEAPLRSTHRMSFRTLAAAAPLRMG